MLGHRMWASDLCTWRSSEMTCELQWYRTLSGHSDFDYYTICMLSTLEYFKHEVE